MKPGSLQRRLLAWVMGALLVVWGSFVVVAYQTGIHEADELTDGHLASAAALLLNVRGAQFVDAGQSVGQVELSGLKSHDYQQSLSVAIWNAQGQLLTKSGEAPEPAFSPKEGFVDLKIGTPPREWRSFSRWSPAHDRKVMVLLDLQERNDLASDIAEQVSEPGFWLLPVVALALGLAIRRGLRPLHQLSVDVAALDDDRGARLVARHPLREFDAVTRAINGLLDSQQLALERERLLASEVAHELRTPLTSIALQAKAMRTDLTVDERAQALQRLEKDALQAGHVLTQLLSLARASRTELERQAEPVALRALAEQVVADHAQLAWEGKRTLGLQPGDADATVHGHPVLIELALRNLVENALQHTPPGTVVEVQLGSDGDHAWLQVCDGGGDPEPVVDQRRGDARGLGLGLRIVQRVVEIHDGTVVRVDPPPSLTRPLPGLSAWRSCYRLRFAAIEHA